MQRAAIGVRTHSGWGALVAVTSRENTVQVLARRRIALIAPDAPGAKQPYHYSENLPISQAEKFLRQCASTSERLAAKALRDLLVELSDRQYSMVGCGLLLASGRELPSLEKVLASHALIHAAEGEFFRHAISNGCKRLNVSVTGIRERDLRENLLRACGAHAVSIERQISTLGRTLGPPWTQDQKAAAMAAFAVWMDARLSSGRTAASSR